MNCLHNTVTEYYTQPICWECGAVLPVEPQRPEGREFEVAHVAEEEMVGV